MVSNENLKDNHQNLEFSDGLGGTAQIFWTGGFDSTFRIVQLSTLKNNIQPYYLSDERKSENYELKAIQTIESILIHHPLTKAHFLPLIIVKKSERKFNTDISDAYRRLLEKSFIGDQYDWLGVFAIDHPGIELCVHKDDKAINIY